MSVLRDLQGLHYASNGLGKRVASQVSGPKIQRLAVCVQWVFWGGCPYFASLHTGGDMLNLDMWPGNHHWEGLDV